MRGKWIFMAGVAVGYVLGARAGRERFDHMVAVARRSWESPTVQGAAGVLQARASSLYDQGKHALRQRYLAAGSRGDRVRRGPGLGTPGADPEAPAVIRDTPGRGGAGAPMHPGAGNVPAYPTTGPHTSRTDTVEAWDLSRRRRDFPANAF